MEGALAAHILSVANRYYLSRSRSEPRHRSRNCKRISASRRSFRHESVRVLTPRGIIETRRLPGSGGGPSPDRLLIVGSEGILGIITQAWMRLQDRLKFRSAELCSLQPLL